MDFRDVVRRRRMVRNYTGEPVDPAVVARIVDTARRGPSAGFSQAQHVVVLTDDEQRASLAALCAEPDYRARGFDPWLSRAPVHLVLCVRPSDYERRYAEGDKAGSPPPGRWPAPYWWVDGGAALMLVLLAAVDEGLAAGFLAVHDTAGLRDLLALPDDVLTVGVVTLGYAAPDRRSTSVARGRRRLDEVVHWGRW